MGWLSPLMTEGQRSQGSLKAEQEFLDITLMPLEVLMVINFLPPFGAAGTRELWVGGEGFRAFNAKPDDVPFLNLGSRETHRVFVVFIMGLEIGKAWELECCIWISLFFCMFGHQQIIYYSSWYIKKPSTGLK